MPKLLSIQSFHQAVAKHAHASSLKLTVEVKVQREAGAQRTLEVVGCTPWFSTDSTASDEAARACDCVGHL